MLTKVLENAITLESNNTKNVATNVALVSMQKNRYIREASYVRNYVASFFMLKNKV